MEGYEKMRVIGRGAYGIVHLCRRFNDKKLVIIKQIPVESMTKDERLSALNEVKVLSMLHHPNIVEYYENFLEDKALMIVMEYAPGGTVADFLQGRNGKLLEESEVLNIFSQILLSLHHVHSKQILHRDLKTQNILLDKTHKMVKVGDFGISKVLSSKSKAYTVVGTPCYISPELCEGKPYNQKSDIWALGCILYELMSLRRAFEAENLPALILKIMRGTFSPISDCYSDGLKQLMFKMLQLDPVQRPSISQIMATPIMISAIIYQQVDVGRLPCRKMCKPTSSLSTAQTKPKLEHTNSKSSITSNYNHDSHQDINCKNEVTESYVFCWGAGILNPVRLPLPNHETLIAEVAATRTDKMAVTKNGRLIIWEQLYDSNNKDSDYISGNDISYIPRFLEGQSAVTIKHVSCGDLFTACITDRGILMTFGVGATGCLGHGNYFDVSQAKIVEPLLGFEIAQVASGASHILAVTNENEIFAWGSGDNGRLGLSDTENHCSPQLVKIPNGNEVKNIVCGIDGSMILTKDNKLLCTGSNGYNKLGLDRQNTVDEVHLFTCVELWPLKSFEITKCCMGTSHSAILTKDSKCYTFGSNKCGQLGHFESHFDKNPSNGNSYMNNNEEWRIPKIPYGLENYDIKFIKCGDAFTMAVDKNGEVLTWGKCLRGRLGRVSENTNIPIAIDFDLDSSYRITAITSSNGASILSMNVRKMS